MCCIIDSSPAVSSDGRYKSYDTTKLFQTKMLDAPCHDCPGSCCWFTGQFLPPTCGCTQYNLRYKLLEGDMKQYQCFQGQFVVCCCIKGGSCGEQSCPELCMFTEACLCNSMALSATRYTVMEKYALSSDPCDNRLIRLSNCLQIASCLCDILAIFMAECRDVARILGWIADFVYHTVSGCATAQTAFELNYQKANPSAQPHYSPNVAVAQPYVDPYGKQGSYPQAYPDQGGYPQQQQYPQQGGYPQQQYPQQGGYPQQQQYPQQGGYPQQQYPQQGYPQQQYPQQGGYPQQQQYPQQQR